MKKTMKKMMLTKAAVCLAFLAAVLIIGASCASFPAGITLSRSWPKGKGNKTAGTVWIASVSADKSGGWISTEKEIADILPLFLLEAGYRAVPDREKADFIVEARAREREFLRGWISKTSVSVEVYFRTAGYENGYSESPVPVAAGRVTVQGNKTLSSSKTLERLLEKAVKKAVRALEKR